MRKDIFGQLHSSKFLAASVVPMPYKYIDKESESENKKTKTRVCCLMLCGDGCRNGSTCFLFWRNP